MELNDDICYQALLAHDPRFDGVFFVGVASTGIYCRTVCTARTPRRENCAFYRSAAEAERAGYRPCLRCRPELAPGNARIDAASRLAAAAASRIEDGALTEGSVARLAAELGVTDRHLRRVVEREFGVSPLELAQTRRLLLARRLLAETDLSIIEVAFASGFSSLRRFNAAFQESCRQNPTAIRKRSSANIPCAALLCEIAYRPPYDWNAQLMFLAGRAWQGVESVEDGCYRRTVSLDRCCGWLSVSQAPEKNTLRVQLSASLAPALVPVLVRIKSLFDLSAHPDLIAAQLGTLAAPNPGLRVPGSFDGFEMAVRAVLGQQISVRAATTLAGRLACAFGEPVQTPFDGLTHRTPAAERIARTDPGELMALGITGMRAATIVALARAVAEGGIVLQPGHDVERTLAQLREIPGVGQWTAQYIAMRALGWPDAFPHTDLGIRKALGEPGPKRVLEIAEAWRPWRAYAVMHLWKSPQKLSETTC